MVNYLKKGDKISYKNINHVNRPQMLGAFTKDNYGNSVNFITQENQKDFNA